ncbi:hypothetical protein B0H12DRAFT_1071132 [Mycena haematopus]|nr:hypothetical protein B0H12DRAFT_1071132 [Mycena haematopus]
MTPGIRRPLQERLADPATPLAMRLSEPSLATRLAPRSVPLQARLRDSTPPDDLRPAKRTRHSSPEEDLDAPLATKKPHRGNRSGRRVKAKARARARRIEEARARQRNTAPGQGGDGATVPIANAIASSSSVRLDAAGDDEMEIEEGEIETGPARWTGDDNDEDERMGPHF